MRLQLTITTTSFLLLLLPAHGRADSGVLNFDDLAIPNTSTCGTYTFSTTESYHGFHILSPGSTATVYNTTVTQTCHPSSSGSGPWNKAASPPNVLKVEDNVRFTSSSGRLFNITSLRYAGRWHWTFLNDDPNAVLVTYFNGYDRAGTLRASAHVEYYSEAVRSVELPGFAGLHSFEVVAFIGTTKARAPPPLGVQLDPWVVYLDDVSYVFE
ncbi:hypothetical protein FN846DRAFT_979323 [Sphaerosporella brunnea]|uniref:Uncharacterized protein n=1 Tax=Sphaerosporella brunnea TaxID=1250544 RepID=A0A5J5EDN9_9PEZI|nr:hypothetical protein FN846DRAFT_979323 [Sphaerosporella brunnea]